MAVAVTPPEIYIEEYVERYLTVLHTTVKKSGPAETLETWNVNAGIN